MALGMRPIGRGRRFNSVSGTCSQPEATISSSMRSMKIRSLRELAALLVCGDNGYVTKLGQNAPMVHQPGLYFAAGLCGGLAIQLAKTCLPVSAYRCNPWHHQ